MKWRSCSLVVLPHEDTSGLQNLAAVAHHDLPAPLSWLLCHTRTEVAVRGWITDFPISGKSRINSPISSTFLQNRIEFQNPLKSKKISAAGSFSYMKKEKKVAFHYPPRVGQHLLLKKNSSATIPQWQCCSSLCVAKVILQGRPFAGREEIK